MMQTRRPGRVAGTARTSGRMGAETITRDARMWWLLAAFMLALTAAAVWPALAAPQAQPTPEAAAQSDEGPAFGEDETFGEGQQEETGAASDDAAAGTAESPGTPPADVLPPLRSDDFQPTERLRADQEVDFPVDI